MTDKNKDSVAINIKPPFTGSYFCNLCNLKLHCQDKETGEYVCPKCYETYFPTFQNVKKSNRFTTPAERDRLPLLSLVKDSNTTQPSSLYHKQKISPSIQQMLNRPGVKITSYQTSEE
jgi:hypothetical protein